MQPELSPTEAIKLAKQVANLLPSPPRIYQNQNGCVQEWPNSPGSENILTLQYVGGVCIPTECYPKITLLTITFEGEAAKQQNDSVTLVQKLKNRIFSQKSNSSVHLPVGGENIIFVCKWDSPYKRGELKHSWWFHVATDHQVKFILESGDNLISYDDGPPRC
ncbi:hypothetical protein H6F78_00985 [Coleofasciculus sp. FACHB-64]|uniref:hypothetical protein n=1 Tax=Cyanophyceae TaxID=3028117 RepID=UPI001688A1B1|nr:MULTISPECIES: hypothetical protein [unclassified Coleofasciculus]MBD1839754.1 hypothetical protein [Coleofasciculus sp. FACHB-501]MBD2044217.1 hypothetical protein [Coleofasciculus sp. FACHB-64]